MTAYKQTDYKEQLGTCNETIASAGCFVCSLASLSGKTPPEVNEILTNGGGYNNGCEVDSQVAWVLLGLDYKGISKTPPNYPCIAETGDYAWQGYNQHFFVYLPSGHILDPLVGFETVNHYNIKNYRLFKGKDTMDEKFIYEFLAESERKARKLMLKGNFDDKGSEADIKWLFDELKRGNKYAFEQLLGRYSRAANFACKDDNCDVYKNKIAKAVRALR